VINFIDGGSRGTRRKPSTCTSYWQTLSHNVYRVHLVWEGCELTTLVVIGTDCIGSCKSNYHTITITTTPTGSCKERWDIFLNLVRRMLFLCHAKVVTCIILFLQKKVDVLKHQMLDSSQGYRKTYTVIKRNNGQHWTKVYIVNIISIRLASTVSYMQTLELLSWCVQCRLYIWYRGFSRKNEKKHARSFNFTFHYRYIDDVLSLNNSKFADFVGVSILLSLKKWIQQIHEWGPVNKTNCTKKEIISMFALWTFHLYVASCCSYQDFLDTGLLLLAVSKGNTKTHIASFLLKIIFWNSL